MITFTTTDHPEANGQKPLAGQQEWVLKFPIENGEELEVRVGRRGRDALLSMLSREAEDDERGTPSVSDVMGVKEALEFALSNVMFTMYAGHNNRYTCNFCNNGYQPADSMTHLPECPYANALAVLEQLKG